MKKFIWLLLAALYLCRPNAHCQGKSFEEVKGLYSLIERDTAYSSDSSAITITERRRIIGDKEALERFLGEQKMRLVAEQANVDAALARLKAAQEQFEQLLADLGALRRAPATPVVVVEPPTVPKDAPPKAKKPPRRKRTKKQ